MPHTAGGGPVFTDRSGRRLRRMKQAGLVLCAAMLACVVVMATGLLGGPGASVIPWGAVNAGPSAGQLGTSGPARSARATPRPVPVLSAWPPGAKTGRSAVPAAGSASGSASPVPVVTNRASKTPPGRNRTPRAIPSRDVNAA